MKHDLYKDGDSNIPSQVCDRNGNVVLSMCKICLLAEFELAHVPDCHGAPPHVTDQNSAQREFVACAALPLTMNETLEEYPQQPQFAKPRTVPELLSDAAATFAQRNALYGDNYKHFGPMMAAMFPDGLTVSGPEAFNRLGVFVQCVSKMTRYAANFASGGHPDSAHDLVTYAAMLHELTANPKKE